MTRKNYRIGALFLVLSLAFMTGLSACTDGPVGIFASIARETDINASRTAAFDGTSPDFVGKLGTSYYTIINGTIWSRPVNGSSWKKVAPPSGVAQGEASSAVVTATHLFMVFGQTGDSTQKIWNTTDLTDWTSVFSASLPGIKIDSLLTTNNQVFAVTRADTTVDNDTTTLYSVYYWNGASFVTAGVAVTGISNRPTSTAYDGTSDYWITAGSDVYSGLLGTLTVRSGTPVDTFAGVVNEATGKMILSSRTGKLHRFDGIWTSSTAFEKSGNPHAFSAPAIVADGSNAFLLVGTVWAKDSATASGYLEFDIPVAGFNTAASANDGSVFADIVNFQTSVSSNYVTAMSVADEGGSKRVFALTMGNGLWSNYFDGTTWAGWARE